MAQAGALGVARARCSLAPGLDGTHSAPYQATRSCAQVVVGRIGHSLHWRAVSLHCKNRGASLQCRNSSAFLQWRRSALQSLKSCQRNGLLRARAQSELEEALKPEKVKGKDHGIYEVGVVESGEEKKVAVGKDFASGVDVQDSAAPKVEEVKDENYGIDEQDFNQDEIPEAWLELMKDGGNPKNYWVIGAFLIVVYLTRKAIWSELKNWGKLALLCLSVVVDVAIIALGKLIKLGGEPLVKVIIVAGLVLVTIFNFVRFIGVLVPFGPVMSAVSLSSVVLVVGDRISDTYSSKQFPSRNTLDVAGLLGLGGFLRIIPVEVMVIGLAAITMFLLGVKKANPVAGFTPAVASIVAVSTPILRYPILATFLGCSVFRYWKLGYLSHGAVMNERTGEYPRILEGLLYLVVFALVARSSMYVFDTVHATISVLLESGAVS